MIVVRLMGGLGNQMFQYALGRRIAHERGVPLKLDLSWFREAGRNADTPREYALGGWRVSASEAQPEDIRTFFPKTFWRRGHVIAEKGTGFQQQVLSARTPALFVGYWQNEKYFQPIESLLRQDFTLAESYCMHSTALLEHISSACAVSVHVRRGDYVSNPSTNAFHGTCSIDYYRRAADALTERFSDLKFFVFSDDVAWARNHLQFSMPTCYVEHDAVCNPHQDIWLMSRCQHHIIANSSFSWWGAWLSPHHNKTVIAPERWFSDPAHNCRNIVPESWIVL